MGQLDVQSCCWRNRIESLRFPVMCVASVTAQNSGCIRRSGLSFETLAWETFGQLLLRGGADGVKHFFQDGARVPPTRASRDDWVSTELFAPFGTMSARI